MNSGGVPGILVAGRYRLVESIGQGGMGRVWRATDEILDRQVAVKEMRIDGLDAEDSGTRRERTLREARATARIDHPNVVRVYDVVDEGERLWIVMELVAGRSLERILAQEGPLSPGETARIGLGLVAALRQVHAGGVLHRDIKPGNVLVENGGGAAGSRRGRGTASGQGPEPRPAERRVVLTDFGIAAIQDAKALTMVGMLVGSPDYMAPERISGHPQGPPSDVWSLGATLCAALGGRSPFARETTLATLHAVLYEEPELPAASGPLRGILTSLLAKDPSARPGLEDLETALEPVAFPVPTAVVPGMGPEPRPGSGLTPGRDPARGEEPEPEPGPETRPSSEPAQEPVAVVQPPRPPVPQDPRRPAPRPGAAPPQHPQHPAPSPRRTPGTAAPPAPAAPTGPAAKAQPSTRPSTGPAAATHHPSPVSLARAQAATEGRPHPTPTPTTMPPGELPGPAAPAATSPRAGNRRTVLAAVGATVATAGAVVGILLATQSGAPGDDEPRAGSSASAPSTTGSTLTPSPTVEGTSRPRSLPPGAHREAGGFAWTTPDGWRRDVKTGAEVHYTSPDGAQELVGKSSLARGDLLETWQTSERNAHQGEDYRKIRLEETTFRGHPAVVWEYTFTLKGVGWHARLLGFNAGGKSYQVNTWYEASVETQALATYEQVKDSFTVL
ncbi:serine/threonine-protein kinase [Streptomyces sp. NPDC006372]|uniref:serine/threonine-protein kinase n=1 Tax=Streptomyces sp. NPDC006372 TaxID=3155599 RepID=UPI0033B477AE